MLLDSNILIHVANYSHPKIEAMLESGKCSVASVVKIEVYGFKDLRSNEATALNAVFRHLSILDLDGAVIEHAIMLRRQRRMGLADSVIAATALEHGLALVTRNVDDFKHIESLRLINPFDP